MKLIPTPSPDAECVFCTRPATCDAPTVHRSWAWMCDDHLATMGASYADTVGFRFRAPAEVTS